jgi:hypothetical protein
MRLQFLIGPTLGCFSPIANRPTQFRATRTAFPSSTSDAIRAPGRRRGRARILCRALMLPRQTPESTPCLIDNFGPSRAIRNHVQTIQNTQHHQILIDNFLDPLLRQLIHEPTGTKTGNKAGANGINRGCDSRHGAESRSRADFYVGAEAPTPKNYGAIAAARQFPFSIFYFRFFIFGTAARGRAFGIAGSSCIILLRCYRLTT